MAESNISEKKALDDLKASNPSPSAVNLRPEKQNEATRSSGDYG